MNDFARWWEGVGESLPPSTLRHADKILSRAGALERHIVDGNPKPLDRALTEYQRAYSQMGSKDRRLLAAAVYGFARNRNAILEAMPEARAGEGRFLSLALDDALATEARTLWEEPGNPGKQTDLSILNKIRKVCTSSICNYGHILISEIPMTARKALETLFSLPCFWLDNGPWETLDEALKELSKGKHPQQPQLRVNVEKCTRPEALSALEAAGIPVTETRRSPWGLMLGRRANLAASKPYREGLVEVQDEGSQLAALACGENLKGMKVLDYCAGAGGKTLALAAALGGDGLLVAHDFHADRLARMWPRLRRAGAEDVVRPTSDGGEIERMGPYDCVLVDAPCSSSGTIRRNPDIAWRWSESEVQAFSRKQTEILEQASVLVKPGGRLVYVTCSLFDLENHVVTERFLEQKLGFHPEVFDHPSFRGIHGVERGALRLPLNLEDYAGDGFYVARFRRH